MGSGDWMEETVRSRRVEVPEEESARAQLATIPVYVWILGFFVALMVMALCTLWGLYLLRGRGAVGGPTPTPILLTATPAPSPTPSPTPTDAPTPTASTEIAIGRSVRVSDTGGDGLRLHEQPGINTPLISSDMSVSIGLEGEIFVVADGPEQADSIAWWLVRDPDDQSREGWAAGNYLSPVNP